MPTEYQQRRDNPGGGGGGDDDDGGGKMSEEDLEQYEKDNSKKNKRGEDSSDDESSYEDSSDDDEINNNNNGKGKAFAKSGKRKKKKKKKRLNNVDDQMEGVFKTESDSDDDRPNFLHTDYYNFWFFKMLVADVQGPLLLDVLDEIDSYNDETNPYRGQSVETIRNLLLEVCTTDEEIDTLFGCLPDRNNKEEDAEDEAFEEEMNFITALRKVFRKNAPKRNIRRCNRGCIIPNCTNKAVKNGVCWRHGGQGKFCSVDKCPNYARNGGVCVRHGAKVDHKRCSREGCTTQARNGGVCIKHGAKAKLCSSEGCTTQARNGGVCIKHGAKMKHGWGQTQLV